MKAIIFDFDGVIHDTFDFHRNKVNEFAGVELSEQEFKDIHNGNFFQSVPEGIKNINWEEYRDHIYHEISNLEIKEEVRGAILELGKNYELYIVTSGGRKNIVDYLENNGILSVFKEILGCESHTSKIEKFKFIFEKNGITPNECVFVTDTLGDILEANSVAMKTVAVDYGYHDQQTLAKGNPHTVISHLRELQAAVKSM